MADPNFARSVILMVENEGGYVGFILNNPYLGVELSDVIEDWQGESFGLCFGGPVEEETLHYIHTYEDLEGSLQVADNLYWGGDFNQIKEWNQRGILSSGRIKFFLGYSGWDLTQLQDEIKKKSWIKLPLNFNIFTDLSEDLWKSILIDKGGEYKEIANYPVDPQLN